MDESNEKQPQSQPDPGSVNECEPRPPKLRREEFSGLQALGITILAVLLYFILADAAFETFLSGSSVRWWVAGPVAAYLALTLWIWHRRPSVWQRIGWPARGSASLFLLLGLLAFTGWLPSGLTDGIRLFGQSTSRVLSLLTIAAIVLASVSLVRHSWLPRWAKWAIGVLAAYALAAFMIGIVSGTLYPDLLHGQSLWTRLPPWLQGAFLGALVIVPAGLVSLAAHILKAAPGISREWDLQQVIAMAMSALMSLSGVMSTDVFGGPQLPSAPDIAQPLVKSFQELRQALAGSKTSVQQTPKQVADHLDKLFPVVETAEREIQRETFDLQAVIDRVGKDPKNLFEWVRDNTYFVPYRGVLRGDEGVLMDRLGNSLDRSILLYAMLRSAGQPVRLARGALTDAQAEDLLKKARPFPSSKARENSASSAAVVDTFIRQYAEKNRVDAGRIRKSLDQMAAQQQAVKKLVQKRVAAQASFIAAAVGRPPVGAAAKEHAEQVRAITDHWWVQWQNGADWVDFDPTLPDSQPGKTLTTAQATSAPDKLTDFGDDMLHTVQIQVVIEVWKHGQVTEIPVLTQKLIPAALIGEPIFLRQVPVLWPQDLNLFHEKNPLNRFKATVLAQTEWLPVLSVGSQNISKYSFNDYGDLTDSTLPGYIQNVMSGRVLAHKMEEGAQGLGQSIGGMLSGPGGQQTPSDQNQAVAPERTQLTAEWIDYEILTPGNPVQTIRREIFDLVGPAARSTKPVPAPQVAEQQRLERELNIVGETEILPLVCQLSSEFIEHLLVSRLLANREALLGVLRNVGPADFKSLNDYGGKLTQLAGNLYTLADARREWSRPRDDVYLSSPNILSFHTRPQLGTQGELSISRDLDIVANGVAVRAGSGTSPFLVRIEQGVLDTNAEAMFMAPWGNVENTAELFNKQGSKNIKWLVLRSKHDADWRALQLPPDARARLEADLSAGLVVIVPKSTVHVGNSTMIDWWRVNPTSGETLGVGERGWGQTGTEQRATEVGAKELVQVGQVLIKLALIPVCIIQYNNKRKKETGDDPILNKQYDQQHAGKGDALCVVAAFGLAIGGLAGGVTSLISYVIVLLAAAYDATNP